MANLNIVPTIDDARQITAAYQVMSKRLLDLKRDIDELVNLEAWSGVKFDGTQFVSTGIPEIDDIPGVRTVCNSISATITTNAYTIGRIRKIGGGALF